MNSTRRLGRRIASLRARLVPAVIPVIVVSDLGGREIARITGSGENVLRRKKRRLRPPPALPQD